MKWKDLIELDNLCNAAPLTALVFCCKASKPCVFRKKALDLLGLTEEEYTRVKEESGIKARGTCFGNLAYCCSLSMQCEARDNALKELGMTPQDYLKYKFKLLTKLIPEEKLTFARMNRVTHMFAFEMVSLHNSEIGYRGMCIGNPELADVINVLNYQPVTPTIDENIRNKLKKEKILSVRINKEIYDRLIDVASENSCNISDLVREAIKIYLPVACRTTEL